LQFASFGQSSKDCVIETGDIKNRVIECGIIEMVLLKSTRAAKQFR